MGKNRYKWFLVLTGGMTIDLCNASGKIRKGAYVNFKSDLTFNYGELHKHHGDCLILHAFSVNESEALDFFYNLNMLENFESALWCKFEHTITSAALSCYEAGKKRAKIESQ